jgi:hypothetical protein
MKTEEIKGFIQLNREAIIQTPWFMNGDLERLGAWISLLLFVNHKRNKISIQGEEIDLEKGQLARSITGLAKDWNKNRKWVRNFLNECKALGYLGYEECAPKGWSLTTKITIKQYDRFLRSKNGDTQYKKNRDTQERLNYQESLDDKKHNGDTSKTVPRNTDNNTTPIKINNISNNNINNKEKDGYIDPNSIDDSNLRGRLRKKSLERDFGNFIKQEELKQKLEEINGGV